MTRDELEQKMAVLMGGRAAEHLVFGHLSTGAADDLAKVADIARSMVMRYAMVPELGNVTYDDQPHSMLGQPAFPKPREFSDETAREIDDAVRALVQRSFERSGAILRDNRTLLEEGAKALLARETLTEADLAGLFARVERETDLPITAEPARTTE